ncbi:MAG: gamma-glutamylcyclotransferase family protein [Cyanobacteria bacterium P01_H01_bin.58]
MLLVFVYGTLKPGEAYYEEYCAPYVVSVTPSLTRGCLYHLPQGYPALTVGDRWVTGSLLHFRNDSRLAQMDEFEDYNTAVPAVQNLYIRQWRPIFTTDQQPLGSAWMYVMQVSRVVSYGGVLIPEGQWSQQHWPSIGR